MVHACNVANAHKIIQRKETDVAHITSTGYKMAHEGKSYHRDVGMSLWFSLLLHQFDKFRHRGQISQTSIQFFDGRTQKTHSNLSTHFHKDTRYVVRLRVLLCDFSDTKRLVICWSKGNEKDICIHIPKNTTIV